MSIWWGLQILVKGLQGWLNGLLKKRPFSIQLKLFFRELKGKNCNFVFIISSSSAHQRHISLKVEGSALYANDLPFRQTRWEEVPAQCVRGFPERVSLIWFPSLPLLMCLHFSYFHLPPPRKQSQIRNSGCQSAVLRLRAQSLMQASIQSVSLPSIHSSRELNDIRLMPPQAVWRISRCSTLRLRRRLTVSHFLINKKKKSNTYSRIFFYKIFFFSSSFFSKINQHEICNFFSVLFSSFFLLFHKIYIKLKWMLEIVKMKLIFLSCKLELNVKWLNYVNCSKLS